MIKLKILIFIFIISIVDGKLPKEIEGGTLVPIGTITYQVSIQISNTHICSGNIISSRHILTSASCVVLDKSVSFGNVKIIVGLHNFPNTQYVSYNDVSLVITHPDFNDKLFWMNDIAILVLSTQLPLRDLHINVGFVSNRKVLKSRLGITGWVIDNLNDLSNSCSLQTIEIRRPSVFHCESIIKKPLDENQACAYGYLNSASITQGDGGSPVLHNYIEIVGIVSVISLTENAPFIFTKINNYIGWIDYIKNIY